jgi:FtsH-binding integral membrane protein
MERLMSPETEIDQKDLNRVLLFVGLAAWASAGAFWVGLYEPEYRVWAIAGFATAAGVLSSLPVFVAVWNQRTTIPNPLTAGFTVAIGFVLVGTVIFRSLEDPFLYSGLVLALVGAGQVVASLLNAKKLTFHRSILIVGAATAAPAIVAGVLSGPTPSLDALLAYFAFGVLASAGVLSWIGNQ